LYQLGLALDLFSVTFLTRENLIFRSWRAGFRIGNRGWGCGVCSWAIKGTQWRSLELWMGYETPTMECGERCPTSRGSWF